MHGYVFKAGIKYFWYQKQKTAFFHFAGNFRDDYNILDKMSKYRCAKTFTFHVYLLRLLPLLRLQLSYSIERNAFYRDCSNWPILLIAKSLTSLYRS